MRDMYGRLPHGSCSAGNDHPLPFLQPAEADQCRKSGDEGNAHGSRLFRREVLRSPRDCLLGKSYKLRVSSVARDPEIAAAAPDFGTYQLGRALDDAAGKVASHDPGQDGNRKPALDAGYVTG